MSTQKSNPSTAFSVSGMARRDPTTAAAISKIVPARQPNIYHDERGNRSNVFGDFSTFYRRMGRRGKRNNDARTILMLLPDLAMAIRIMISSILSPSDMTKTEVTYQAPKGIYASDLSSSIIAELTSHFETEYKVKELLHAILLAVLQNDGAYPVAVIPENALDAFINGRLQLSQESLGSQVDSSGVIKPTGILGAPGHIVEDRPRLFATESYTDMARMSANRTLHLFDEDMRAESVVSNIVVVDNPMLLKFPAVHRRLKAQAMDEALHRTTGAFSLESELSDRNIEAMLYQNRQPTTHQPYAQLQPQSEMTRRSVGAPLVQVFPTESLAPVHVPGQPEKHIAYFLALDNEGNPVTMSSDDAYYNTVGKGLSQPALNGGGVHDTLMKRINANFGQGNAFDAADRRHVDFASQIWAELVDRDLISRIKNGVHGSSVAVAGNEDFYRVMLARTLQQRFTQILYIPAQYLTYFTFAYDEFGMGQSLLDETATINTLRSVLQFSNVMAAVRNSIGRTHVDVTIPDDDPDWLKTAEEMQHNIVRSRQLDLPQGITNAADITRFLTAAGIDFTFTGKDIPQMKVEYTQSQTSYPKADSDLMEELRKQSYMGIGVPAQTVDNGFSGDLATTVVASNILLAKRVTHYQEAFCPMIMQHLRQYITHHQPLIEKLRSMVLENIDKIKYDWTDEEDAFLAKLDEEKKKTYQANRTLRHFLDGMTVTLPKPPEVTMENMNTEFEAWSQGMDKALDMYLSSDFITDATGGMELSSHVDAIRAMIKSYFGRQWLATRGMLPELGSLVAVDDEGNPQVDLLKETTRHVQSMVRTCVQALAEVKPMAAAADADLQRMGTPEGGDSSGSGGSGEGDDGFGDSGGGDDNFGGDADMNLGTDTGGTSGGNANPDEASPDENQDENNPAA